MAACGLKGSSQEVLGSPRFARSLERKKKSRVLPESEVGTPSLQIFPCMTLSSDVFTKSWAGQFQSPPRTHLRQPFSGSLDSGCIVGAPHF